MANVRASPSASTSAAAERNEIVLLERYRVGRLLGRGSFAKVFYARALKDGAEVALKVIEKGSSLDADMAARILREIEAMSRVRGHPNILKIQEVMASRTKIFLVMEFAKGGDITPKITANGGRFQESTARRYFQQMVSALYFCHQKGIFHRDLKPQNLLLDENGDLKVSDFGLAALPEQLVADGLLHTACGTPAFTAPEVFAGSPRQGYDGSLADAWSCGVILFAFLVGYLPFDDSYGIPTMYLRMLSQDFQFPSWVSKEAKSIIRRLLQPSPSSRMSLETLMAHPWFRKSLSLDSFHGYHPFHGDGIPQVAPPSTFMNAFDLINCMSTGLEGLVLPSMSNYRERRFISKASVEAIEQRMAEVGEKMGCKVDKVGGRIRGFVRGQPVLMAEILMLMPELVVVVVKIADAAGVEFKEEEFRGGLEGIALSWNKEVS
ncbi:CBL-interacting serine/threonine-protein kinase 7-like [Diospyros lotus]|uniref:CBL-interacting serine/threonine-protein kinase 7-like n=1 Tax=Diospyros lotus TaxID=55363 RepID=UPI0022541AFF|nr:CBL-interacting serine/threonine-protein kinase 7-like [Diospyros lotus]